MTFDLDSEHYLDADAPGNHSVKVCLRIAICLGVEFYPRQSDGVQITALCSM